MDRDFATALHRSLEDLTATFIRTTIGWILRDYRQTAAVRTGDGYRVDHAATTPTEGGRTGKGSIYLRNFGPVACGVTFFVVDGSTSAARETLDLMMLSLTYTASVPAATPATPQR